MMWWNNPSLTAYAKIVSKLMVAAWIFLLATTTTLSSSSQRRAATVVAAFPVVVVVSGGVHPIQHNAASSTSRTASAAALGRMSASTMRTALPPYGSNHRGRRLPTTRLSATLVPRGGATATAAAATGSTVADVFNTVMGMGHDVIETVTNFFLDYKKTPGNLFNVTLLALAVLTIAAKTLQQQNISSDVLVEKGRGSDPEKNKPAAIQSIQRRFLPVFWLLRCSDWLQGPYFYEVYASKVINGAQASLGLVSRLFLTGFASTALFGPSVGRAADAYGRKRATIAFSIIYALGAWSTKSTLLQLLFAGRVLSGIGTSLLFSAPESWLVAEAQNSKMDEDGKYLGETFGLAYAGDSIVAILAGQMAAFAATHRGPTGPFELSTGFLIMGGLMASVLWGENKATLQKDETTSIKEAVSVVRKDPKIMLVGAVQSLFEAAMYIFVLQWPPAMAGGIQKFFSKDAVTPFGGIFSCFMACCLLGSTLFGMLSKWAVRMEQSTTAMLTVATISMTLATWTVQQSTLSLPLLMLSFFFFEACVGMYFPSIGTLRSRYVPDSHRSVIMNLFGIPLNVLVVSVFLSIHKLGVGGALSISSGALGLATLCMFTLRNMTQPQAPKQQPSKDGMDFSI